MATDRSKAVGQDYRGLGKLSKNWKFKNFKLTHSSLTQANPRPGTPEATQITDMVLETSGNMANTNPVAQTSLTVKTLQGGMPGVQGARFSFTPNYSLPASYQTEFGWESTDAISRLELIDSGVDFEIGGCITLQSNAVLMGGQRGAGARIWRKTFDATGFGNTGNVRWGWSNVALPLIMRNVTSDVDTFYSALGPGSMISFIQLPEGRVHCYRVGKFNDAFADQDYYQVIMYFSDDDGATWAIGNTACLSRQIFHGAGVEGAAADGFILNRIRTAYSNGQVLMLLGGICLDTTTFTFRDSLFQYASADLGTGEFQLIDISGGTRNDGALIAAAGSDQACGQGSFDITVVKASGGFGISYARANPAVGDVGSSMWKELGTAFTAWDVVDPDLIEGGSHGSLAGSYLVGTSTTCASDENGIIWVSWEVLSVGQSSARVSYDDGATWTDITAQLDGSATASTWWDSGDTACFPTRYCSTFQCGRWLFFTFGASDGGENEAAINLQRLWEIDQGGYSTVTRPFKNSTWVDDDEITWDRNWVPFARLSDVTNWTAAGAGVETLGNGQTQIVTGGGVTKTISNAGINAVTTDSLLMNGLVEFQVTAGTSRCEVVIGDGVNILWLRFQFSTTQFQVIDINAGATLVTVAAPLPAGMNQVYFQIQWLPGIGTGLVCAYVRESLADWEVRPWVLALPNTSILKSASVATSRISTDQPANSTSNWKMLNWVSGIYGEPHQFTVTNIPTELYGRTFSGFPIHVYSGDGVRLRAVDGPTWGGPKDNTGVAQKPDTWKVNQRWEYGIENIFPEISPTPRKTWRSTGTGSFPNFAVELGLDADDEPILGRVLFIAAFNCNFRQLNVDYRLNSGAGWTALGVLDFASGQTGLRFTRDGRVVRPDTASGVTSATDYFTYNILEGSHFLMPQVGGTPAAVREIGTNSEGKWTDAVLNIRPRIYLNGVTGAEPVSGSAGEIWSKDGLLIIRDCPDIYELRFSVAGSSLTAQGYFEIGTLMVGHLAYFGKQYARGRAVKNEPNYNLTTGRGGSRRAQSPGPMRRGVEFSWANENETDQSQVGPSPDPDYILPATGSTNPVATPADTPYKMAGLVESCRGGTELLVYSSKIPMVGNENADTTQVNRNLFMLGRLLGDVRIETVLGSEWTSSGKGELSRITTQTFEEET